MQDRKDRELMAEVVVGSEPAFADLFRRYGPVANGLAVRVLGDPALAEEVLQEVFLSVWRGARNYGRARGSVRAWILAQVHHRAVDVVRREEATRRRLSRQAVLPNAEIDDVIEQSWIATPCAQVRRSLSSLSNDQRRVLELAYYGGMTQTQIAEQENIPLGTVKSRTLSAVISRRGGVSALSVSYRLATRLECYLVAGY